MNTNDAAPKTIKPTCPSCGRKFRGIEPLGTTTTVHVRTCRTPSCRETWQVIVRPLRVWGDGGRIDKCDLVFLHHNEVAQGLYE